MRRGPKLYQLKQRTNFKDEGCFDLLLEVDYFYKDLAEISKDSNSY